MTDPAGNVDPRHMPCAGDVAYFVKLHLDTAVKKGPHAHREDHRVYEVEGKPRPMLVMQLLTKRCRGRRQFLVLPITSQGHDEKGTRRSDVKPIGRCIDDEHDSFVEMERWLLPENLLHAPDGKSPMKKPCEPFAVQNVQKIMNVIALGGGSQVAFRG